LGARPVYFQEAANPETYHPYSELPKEFDVTFVGQAYGNRPAYIRYLLDSGIDVRVWGYGWDGYSGQRRARSAVTFLKRGIELARDMDWRMSLRNVPSLVSRIGKRRERPGSKVALPNRVVGPPLSDSEMVRMFSRSRINLGFSTCREADQSGRPILQVRLRDFEIPMSGGFYMVEYMEELEEFFCIGKEVVCYTSVQDLAEKIEYFLSHGDEREGIARAGHDRCLRHHTWQKRFIALFQEIGLNDR